MARPLRIEYEGAWYHVMNRGAGQRDIFLDDNHRFVFLSLLSEIHRRYSVEIHSYCLMSNHYHLLLRTPLANLARAMRHLDGVYTQAFNKETATDGPLFRGRYKSIIVESDHYLSQLSRYIHLNPVQAKLVSSPEIYVWSSYRAFISISPRPSWLYCDDILDQISLNNREENYQLFIEEGIDRETLEYFQDQNTKSIFGSERFIQEVTEMCLKKRTMNQEIPELKRLCRTDLLTTTEIIQVIANYFAIRETEVYNPSNNANKCIRRIAIYLSVLMAKQKLVDVGLAFGLSPSTISRTYNNVRKTFEANTEQKLCDHVRNLNEVLAKFKT